MKSIEETCIPENIFIDRFGMLATLDCSDRTKFPIEVPLNHERLLEVIEVYNNWRCGNLEEVKFGFRKG